MVYLVTSSGKLPDYGVPSYLPWEVTKQAPTMCVTSLLPSIVTIAATSGQAAMKGISIFPLYPQGCDIYTSVYVFGNAIIMNWEKFNDPFTIF